MTLRKYIPFRIRFDFEDRSLKYNRFITGSLQQSIALIIEPLSDSKMQPFDNCKFAIEKEKTLNYLKSMLQAKLNISESKSSLYLFVGKKLLHEGNAKMGDLYEKYQDADGFMYISYAESNPF
jgi:GABA(A) receptor-associated protein